MQGSLKQLLNIEDFTSTLESQPLSPLLQLVKKALLYNQLIV